MDGSSKKRTPRLGAEALGLLRRCAGSAEPPYLVGGALRDILLGRPFTDLDLATASARATALRLAKTFHGKFVTLDAQNAVYRVALPAKGTIRYLDVARLQGKDIFADLRRRDFTVNAMALPVTPAMRAEVGRRDIIDPRGGLDDLENRRIRMESAELLEDDPLRGWRAFRIAAQLGFTIETGTLEKIRAGRRLLPRPAPERIQRELLLLLAVPGCSEWLRLMDQEKVLTTLFPELEPARRCAVEYYGPGGVMKHSLDTVARADFLFQNLSLVFGGQEAAGGGMGRKISASLAERSIGEIPFHAVLILAALLHDIAKPACARRRQGRLRFFGHDLRGSRMAEDVLKALRFSSAHIKTVGAVIANHLRPGNLAASARVTDKAVYRFFRDMGDDAVSLLLVCWADHASYLPEDVLLKNLEAARRDPNEPGAPPKPAEAQKTVRHLQVVSHLLRCHCERARQTVPEKLLTGHDVMKALGLPPSPKIGEILDEIREAQAEGKIRDRAAALAHLARLRLAEKSNN